MRFDAGALCQNSRRFIHRVVTAMSSTASIAASGMNAAQARLAVSAHNIANLETPGFRRQQVAQSASASGGVNTGLSRADTPGASLETDVVAQLQAKNAFLANLAVFKTSNRLTGVLLDKTA
jgi:flagellar hook-associated protein FlgK